MKCVEQEKVVSPESSHGSGVFPKRMWIGFPQRGVPVKHSEIDESYLVKNFTRVINEHTNK